MAYLLDEALSDIKHGGLANFLSMFIIGVTIVILSTLILVGSYINTEVSQLKEEVAIVAFLKDNSVLSDIENLRIQIEDLASVESVKYVSKKEALTRAREVFGEHGEIIIEGFRGVNPLPASFEIKVQSAALEPKTVEQIASQISSYEQIEDVSYEKSSSEFIRNAELLVTGIGFLLGCASIAVVCFSIMLTSYFRKEEIRIMRLVGATYWYIRLPLILQGIILGFLGTIIGLVIFYLIFQLFAVQFGTFSFLSLKQLLVVILIGTGLGLVGSLIPVGRHFKI